jgi:hypothetical protein
MTCVTVPMVSNIDDELAAQTKSLLRCSSRRRDELNVMKSFLGGLDVIESFKQGEI